MQTRRDEVLAYLTDQPEGADDDQIASALAIRRQEVNAICRRLADEGRVIRQIGGDGKLVNQRANLDTPEIHLAEPAPPLELPNITVAGPIVLLHAEQEALNLAYPGELMVSEDTVKAVLRDVLEAQGWRTDVRFGHERGIDIAAERGNERLVIEAKGEGSRDAMRVNYFLGALGELLQRMEMPGPYYGLAFPAHRQLVRLALRLPPWIRGRLNLCFFFVRPDHGRARVGFVPPRDESGQNWSFLSS